MWVHSSFSQWENKSSYSEILIYKSEDQASRQSR